MSLRRAWLLHHHIFLARNAASIIVDILPEPLQLSKSLALIICNFEVSKGKCVECF
jgi:hypothetical protein